MRPALSCGVEVAMPAKVASPATTAGTASEFLVRHVHQIDAGLVLEHLAGKMRLAAAAVGRVVDRSRLSLRQGDQFRQAVRGQRRVRDQELVQQHEHGRRDEIAPCIVGQLAVEVRVDRESGVGGHEDGVPVGRALGDGIRGDDGVRAGLVLHDDGLAPGRLQLVGELARHDVDAAAGRVGDDDAHRLRRPRLAEGRGEQASSRQASECLMTILLLC